MTNSKRVVLIDNYDSFTWNIYQYLCQAGAEVIVHRNDKITVEEIEALRPDLLFISPGPGHPSTDAGISREAIHYFAGTTPVFGVCMGLQCIYEVFGGKVTSAGEIIHGKTSEVYHDNRGVFRGVPQGAAVTRYHSLAGSPDTLPEELEVSAKTSTGIIMGIRHKTYTVEAVQFHPESILSEEGHLMISNLLKVEGGTWAENDLIQSKATVSPATSILDEIRKQRERDVERISSMPGTTFEDLETNFRLGLAPSVRSFYDTLANARNGFSVIAEIKRASPSKGDINSTAHAASQALKYAAGGAAAISVLTEPYRFKGCLQDLVNVRRALDITYAEEKRPCVLRKEFIFSKYQVLEARLTGADTVLLIVKMLSQELLKELYTYATAELRMEPLVEVNNEEELERALEINARVIGVNNRNLHSFMVDLATTSSMVNSVPKDVLLVALSGITQKSDAEIYKKQGVRGLLVGEALMKADNVEKFLNELIE